MGTSLTRTMRRATVATLAVLTVGVAGVGLLHTPGARSLLQRIGGCPVGRATPAQVEAAQRRAWRTLQGSEHAPARPALGFALGEATLPQIRAWAAARGLTCEVLRGGALLRCDQV